MARKRQEQGWGQGEETAQDKPQEKVLQQKVGRRMRFRVSKIKDIDEGIEDKYIRDGIMSPNGEYLENGKQGRWGIGGMEYININTHLPDVKSMDNEGYKV